MTRTESEDICADLTSIICMLQDGITRVEIIDDLCKLRDHVRSLEDINDYDDLFLQSVKKHVWEDRKHRKNAGYILGADMLHRAASKVTAGDNVEEACIEICMHATRIATELV